MLDHATPCYSFIRLCKTKYNVHFENQILSLVLYLKQQVNLVIKILDKLPVVSAGSRACKAGINFGNIALLVNE